jgi:hypothetical protein
VLRPVQRQQAWKTEPVVPQPPTGTTSNQ